MKCVDADSLVKALAEARDRELADGRDGLYLDVNSIIELIQTSPAVDAVEVIRCKDCLFWTGFKLADGSECEGVCDVGEERCITNSNGYCYWAKVVKNTCG